MASLQAGDVVLVTELDRLGCSTRELLDLIERIGQVGAAFRSLGDLLFDTTSSQDRLVSRERPGTASAPWLQARSSVASRSCPTPA